MNLKEQSNEYPRIDVESKIRFYDTRYKFLEDQNGIRPGMDHILISTTGAGKSTLFRGIVLDTAKEHDVMLYSSEETCKDLTLMFGRSKTDQDVLQHIHLLHDNDVLKAGISLKDGKGWAKVVLDFFKQNKCSAFFFDNLTTSVFYIGLGPDKQSEFWIRLESIFNALNVPTFTVAHTATGVSDMSGSLIGPDNIAGSRTPTKRAEYCYCMQRFLVEDNGTEQIYSFVRVAKSRQHDTQGNIYHLDYNSLKKEFSCDRKVSYRFFNDQFIARFRMGIKK